MEYQVNVLQAGTENVVTHLCHKEEALSMSAILPFHISMTLQSVKVEMRFHFVVCCLPHVVVFSCAVLFGCSLLSLHQSFVHIYVYIYTYIIRDLGFLSKYPFFNRS